MRTFYLLLIVKSCHDVTDLIYIIARPSSFRVVHSDLFFSFYEVPFHPSMVCVPHCPSLYSSTRIRLRVQIGDLRVHLPDHSVPFSHLMSRSQHGLYWMGVIISRPIGTLRYAKVSMPSPL